MAEHPVAGVDYPARWRDFLAWFPDDAHCLAYLERLRWGIGFGCPRCGGQSAWQRGDGLRRCSDCCHTTSVTAGTIFHLTRTPLTTWFAAVWYITNQKNGVSALGLQRVFGIDYSTAWTWLQKLRRAMVCPGRDQLCGTVEVDETYVGGPEKGVFGRETETKSIVVVAAEENGRGIGRIRLARVHDVSAGSLIPFVEEVIQPGTKVHTDGWPGYDGLRAKGYRHKVTNIKRSEKLAHELMPRVHRVAALLKRWILGTHQGSVSDKHLPYYLDEFTFRFNRRHSKARGMLFYRLLQQAVQTDPAPYAAIVGENAP